MLYLLGISESPIPSLSDPRDDHAFARALLLAGIELPCDAARLQPRSSTKRGTGRIPDKKEARGDRGTGSDASAALAALGGGPGLQPAIVQRHTIIRARPTVARTRKHDHPLGPIAK